MKEQAGRVGNVMKRARALCIMQRRVIVQRSSKTVKQLTELFLPHTMPLTMTPARKLLNQRRQMNVLTEE